MEEIAGRWEGDRTDIWEIMRHQQEIAIRLGT